MTVMYCTLSVCLQSLHTTVLPLGTTSERKPLFPLELHIRTGEMHRLAEYGIAGLLLKHLLLQPLSVLYALCSASIAQVAIVP